VRFVGTDLSHAAVLVILAILTSALVLGHVHEVSQRRDAEDQALTLLKKWLSRTQLAKYETYGYFEVIGGDSGKHYRIRPTRQMNVDELDQNGARTAAWCFGPEGGSFQLATSCWRRRLPWRITNGPPSKWQTGGTPMKYRQDVDSALDYWLTGILAPRCRKGGSLIIRLPRRQARAGWAGHLSRAPWRSLD
jgi:hypothetical protein